MIRKVLLALDDSPSSEAAIGAALEISRNHEVRLTGMGVLDVPGITAPAPTPLGGDSYKSQRDATLLEDAQRRVRAFLGGFAEQCTAAGADFGIVESEGVPAVQIECESHNHDLIVIGRDTNFQFETADADPVTLNHLASRTPRPLLIVPVGEPRGQRVVVAYDGSLQASRALQLFVLLGLHRDREVHVVSVYPSDDSRLNVGAAVADLLQAHAIDAHVHKIESSDRPADVILDRLGELQPEVIVMGSYGLSGLRALFGSFTRTMLTACPVPMFVYH